MRILTLTQPWATLVAIGAKKIETRGWRVGYRGPIAIHAAHGLGPVGEAAGLRRLCRDNDIFYRALRDHITSIHGSPMEPAKTLPRGAIVAVATLHDVVPTKDMVTSSGNPWSRYYYGGKEWTLTEQERAFGDYTEGRFGWLLADVRPLRVPLTYRGTLGLQPLPPEVADDVRGRVA